MTYSLLLSAMLLMWLAAIVGAWQRLFEMPKWFSNPPASFELIRDQRKARIFWIPLSVVFIAIVSMILATYGDDPEINSYLIKALFCFITSGILSMIYFSKEEAAFVRTPRDIAPSDDLRRRVKFWQRWTTVRDVLQLLAAIFVTAAFVNFRN